jgi:hypothetical protein
LVTELIEKAVEKIFPIGSKFSQNPLEVPLEDRFWLIPGKNEPRWLIPQEKKYGLPVFQQWRPYALSSRTKWKILYTAYCTGQMGLIPGVQAIGISWNNKNQWQHLGWDRESMPAPVVYFGTRCRAHKAVAILVDSINLRPSIVVKAPLSESAAKSIIHEYNILCYLEQKKPGIAPKPIFSDNVSGIATQEAIIGRTLGRKFTKKHWGIMEELIMSNSHTTVTAQSQKLLLKLSIMNGLELSTKNLLMCLLEESFDSSSLPIAFVHGDFAPWNIKKIRNDSLMVFDWEMADLSGLPLYDFFYFFLMQSYLFNDKLKIRRIFKLLHEYQKKYPLTQILKFTAASLGLRIADEIHDFEYLENFLESIQ